MLQAHHRFFHRLIQCSDLLVVLAAVVVGSNVLLPYLGFEPVRERWDIHAVLAQGIALGIAWFLVAWRTDFYQSRRTQDFLREIEGLVGTLFFAMAGAVLVLHMTMDAILFRPAVTFVTGVVGLGLLRLLVRVALRNLRYSGRNFRRVAIIGRGRAARELAYTLRANPHFGIKVVGSFHFAGSTAQPPEGLPCLGDVAHLEEVLADHPVDLVILSPSLHARAGEIQRVFDACDQAGLQCFYAPDFFSTRNVRSSVTWFGEMPAFAFRNGAVGTSHLLVKRSMDVIGAAVGLIVGAPVMLACAAMIKLQDGGPVLFRQKRVGKDGKIFECLKFRSMCLDADAQKVSLAAFNEAEGPVFKMRQDPRVTPIGRVLRKYSLDELPQLFNVLCGEMSLVGPRPPVPAEVARYEWWQRRRISVRPGLTCVWQVWGRNQVSFKRWVEMDLYYIDNWSLWLDVKLILHTVRSVFGGTGV